MIFGVKNPTKSGGKLTFDFNNEMKFGGSGATIFARGDTYFKSGNVGIGGTAFNKKFKLHVKGDMKVEGKCYVAQKRGGAGKKKAKKSSTKKTTKKKSAKKGGKEEELEEADFDEFDMTDLLEEAEGSSHNTNEHGVDVGETLHSLTKVLRKQYKQMGAHDARIAELSQQMNTLMATRR